jgi:hypothetical protein
MLNGWMTRTAKELDATIETWGEMLNEYEIPYTAYNELYALAFDRRQEILRTKGDVIQMDAALLVSCWTGEYGLKEKLRQRQIDAGRTLTGQAQSQCLDCFGTGIKIIPGVGAQPGCTHEHIETGEEVMDFTDVDAALVQPARDETAVEICSRVRQGIAKTLVMSPDPAERQKAWVASRTWAHAEKYCRENDNKTS